MQLIIHYKCLSKDILLFQTDEKALRSPVNASILLASFTYGWRVHNWKQFFNVIDEKLVEQPFISLLQDQMMVDMKENFRYGRVERSYIVYQLETGSKEHSLGCLQALIETNISSLIDSKIYSLVSVQ